MDSVIQYDADPNHRVRLGIPKGVGQMIVRGLISDGRQTRVSQSDRICCVEGFVAIDFETANPRCDHGVRGWVRADRAPPRCSEGGTVGSGATRMVCLWRFAQDNLEPHLLRSNLSTTVAKNWCRSPSARKL